MFKKVSDKIKYSFSNFLRNKNMIYCEPFNEIVENSYDLEHGLENGLENELENEYEIEWINDDFNIEIIIHYEIPDHGIISPFEKFKDIPFEYNLNIENENFMEW